jgi:hypothetical protein
MACNYSSRKFAACVLHVVPNMDGWLNNYMISFILLIAKIKESIYVISIKRIWLE